MRQLMDAGIALLNHSIVEKFELVEPAEREVREPRADQPNDEVDDDCKCYGEADIERTTGHHEANHETGHHGNEQAERDRRGKEESEHRCPPQAPSYRRKSVSREQKKRHPQDDSQRVLCWIPAFAGMTIWRRMPKRLWRLSFPAGFPASRALLVGSARSCQARIS